jgi:hypothetical protein
MNPQGHQSHGHHGQYPPQPYPQQPITSDGSSTVTTILVVIGILAVVAVVAVLAVVFLGVVVSSASGGGGSIKEHVILNDGEFKAWPLPKGTWEAHITSTGDGVDVVWVGGSCTRAENENNYTATCALTSDGQIEVTNSHLLGLGKAASVTIEVHR